MNGDVKSGDMSDEHCFMDSHNISEAKKQVPYILKIKGKEILPIYLKWKILDYRMMLILIIFSASKPHQYSNI